MGISINDLLFLSDGYCYSCKDEEYDYKYFCSYCKGLFEHIDGVKNIGDYKCYSPYLYSGKLADLIQEYKFSNGAYLYRAFGELLLEYIKLKKFKFDIIIPVPLSKKKLNRRGYNQSELIADYIGNKLGIEVRDDIVIKEKNTKDQHLLNAELRAGNLKDAFRVMKNSNLKNKKILLLDDIVTSGYTLKTIIDELEKSNFANLTAITIASSNKESIYKIAFKDI